MTYNTLAQEFFSMGIEGKQEGGPDPEVPQLLNISRPAHVQGSVQIKLSMVLFCKTSFFFWKECNTISDSKQERSVRVVLVAH